MEDRGVIERYTAVLSAAALGYNVIFVVDLTLRGQSEEAMREFEEALLRIPEVLECQLMTGQNDYILRVAAKSTEDYEETHHRLARLPGVSTIQSSLALRTVKPWTGLPV
ncbi:MAG: Lrp/AsnC family transcriptional regulator [Pseudomonadota bacterium]